MMPSVVVPAITYLCVMVELTFRLLEAGLDVAIFLCCRSGRIPHVILQTAGMTQRPHQQWWVLFDRWEIFWQPYFLSMFNVCH